MRPIGNALGVLVFALAVASGLAPSAHAANTSRPTGKGAIQDNSVYCQEWPGGPSRPAYPGTGPQTPCGPNFQRSPAPPPPPPPEEDEAGIACPARGAALDQPRLLWAAASAQRTHGLWVGDSHVTDARTLNLGELSQLRQEVLDAMICSPHRVFWFADRNELQWTIELRVKIITLMQALRNGRSQCHFIGEVTNPRIHPPSAWELYPEPAGSMRGQLGGHPELGEVSFAARASTEVATAHAAIQAFRTEASIVDCLSGMELTILDAADSVLGEANFNQFHRRVVWPNLSASDPAGASKPYVLVGLGVPLLKVDPTTNPYRVTDNRQRTSLGKHLVIVRYHVAGGTRGKRSLDRADDALAGTIATADMVPGDYAYLSNLPDYPESGFSAGENAFYLGEGASHAAYFYGYGYRDPNNPERSVLLTEQMLKDGMAADYNANRPRTPATAEEMQWTFLGAPTLYGNPRHAGMFEQQ